METAEEAREAAATFDAEAGELEENDYEITWYPQDGPPSFVPEEEEYEEPVVEEEEGDEGTGGAGGDEEPVDNTEFCAALGEDDCVP